MKAFAGNRFVPSMGWITVMISWMILAAGCGVIAQQMVFHNPKVKSILDEPQFDRTVNHRGHIEFIPRNAGFIGDQENRIAVLYVSGTPYEMGYEHGRLLKAQVRESIHDVEEGTSQFLPSSIRKSKFLTASDTRNIVNALLDRAWAKMAPFTPRQDLEEMVGLADGSGIPLAVIHRMHAIPDLSETSCSALVAKDRATKDGHVYQLRILDYGGNFHLQRRPLITVYRPETTNAFVNIGWVGFVGVVSGVNDQSVALSEMGFGNPPGETLAGKPMPFLLKDVLRYAQSAAEGSAIIRAAPRTNSYVYFLGDKHQGAIGMITSAQQCTVYRANEQKMIEMGNVQLPQFQDVVYAGHYAQKQAELVRQIQGSIDLASIQQLAREIAMKSNLHTVIYDLTDDKIWVANRKEDIRASDRPYVEFSLADAWTKY